MAKKKKGNNKNLIIIAAVVGILIIIMGICILNKKDTINLEDDESPIQDILTPKFSPLELFQQKEDLEGKRVTVLGAYIPSELFIYIKDVNGRIYLKPSNTKYCRNYDLDGTLKYNYVTSKWELEVENYDNCLD
jgi:hypothetical protein